MFGALIEKELKGMFLGPKFLMTFGVCSLLILLSLFLGIQDYRAAVSAYQAGNQLVDQEMQEKTSWMSLSTRIYREPNPMQIFIAGVNHDIGRYAGIHPTEPIKLTNSVYSDDPIFAVFRFLDFSVIVQIVLSLFAVLFTYDAIAGERENGTLSLVFSNAVPRLKYILAKFIGSWLGMVVPLLLPLLFGMLMIFLFRIPFTQQHWLQIGALFGASLLYFTFFIALGIFISSLTRRASVSFLILLVVWVTCVFILPRIGVMMAGNFYPVPSAAEIDGQIEGYSKDRWDRYIQAMEETMRKRNAEMEGLSESEREAYREAHLWEWMQESDSQRSGVQADINEFSRKLNETQRNKQAEQERLAFSLARISPAAAFQLTAMNLAETDIRLKSRFGQSLETYHASFVDYADQKQKEGGMGGGIQITFDSNDGMRFSFGRDKGKLDVSGLPRYQSPGRSVMQILHPALMDFTLLAVYTLLALTGSFMAFMKYDVR
ncbi:MAG: ABC transporter permease subunit [Candidatus Zhuqueibacterota bacterium]